MDVLLDYCVLLDIVYDAAFPRTYDEVSELTDIAIRLGCVN